jgi:uncharacterized protein YndB with AHSA1/START domain
MADGNMLGAGYEMTINRTFNAPAALVFDCFTDPVHFPNGGGRWAARARSTNWTHGRGARFPCAWRAPATTM